MVRNPPIQMGRESQSNATIDVSHKNIVGTLILFLGLKLSAYRLNSIKIGLII